MYISNGKDAVYNCSFKNPILVPGDKPQPFTLQSRSMWAAECQLAANPVDGSNADVLYVGDDGLPYVLEKWKKVTLDGTLNWTIGTSTPPKGKQVRVIDLVRNGIPASGHVTKYNGMYIPQASTSVNIDTQAVSADGSFYLSIANTDSGWGDSYTPTADEIKAYFNGWKMYDTETSKTAEPYNRTDGKYKGWVRRNDAGQFVDGTGTLPTTQAPINSQWQPYRLQYLKAKPTVEPVSNYETGLTLSKGWNMVEVCSGVVIREKANAAIGVSGEGNINNPYLPATMLNYKTFVTSATVYKNGTVDRTWIPKGDNVLQSNAGYYDPTAVYHVTYTMLDPTLPAPINGSIAANLRGTVTDVVRWASDAERRLSVVENGAQDNISLESIGAAKKTDLDALANNSVSIKKSASKDFNTYRDPGLYYIGAVSEYANSPSNDAVYSWGILRVETLGTTAYVVQSYTSILSNVTFTRSKAEDASGRGWEPWRATAKLDADGVLRLNKWVDIRGDAAMLNSIGTTHAYHAFIVGQERSGYVGSSDPNAPGNIALVSDKADVLINAKTNIWMNAFGGAIHLNGRNILWEIDQLKQSGVNNKQALVDALNAKGIAASINEDWGTLVSKVQQTSYMRSVNLDRESEIRESNSTFEHIYTIPAGVKRIIFTSSSNWATQMYTSYDSPTLEIALKDANGLYRIVASNYYNSYRYRSLDVYSFVVDFTLNISRSSYRVSSSDNVYNAEGIGISNAGEIQLGFLYFTNGYYNGKGKINGTLQYQ
ncbi:pyocin knob domain-containing protein [Paenibacillus sp.]|uniref:pyocin knob domain-containing protein n=1 Tax=Paenibacillus sp. TaxID=58172 RepID=UPI003463F6BB